ncbi:MAG TPA: ABC transporter permease [Thermoflexales bacterium]|nr:ABC transporter permease [Thermoflexales bacterium]HQW36924.1 ABC transporter permease [Thermoflexales bacterium]HQZ20641.1 ABC transporter permease [Thermoflexales bacterium]HRA00812.1 ABC transporter permease [Thermoflexales bacterium]
MTGSIKKSMFPFSIKIEPRLDTPKWLSPLVTVGAVVVALLLGMVVLALVGGDPIAAYKHIADASFGDIGVFSDTLVKATPLIFIGLGCAVAFRMKLWNIGAEGQLYIGALAASALVLSGVINASWSPVLAILAMIVASMIGGAIWGAIPGFLKAKLNVNEIITTLMMNYIAISLVNFFVFAVWSEKGFQMSAVFPKNTWLPRLADFAAQVPEFRGLTTHFGLVIALVAVVVVWFILYRSKWGYEIRLTGDNAKAASYAGINIVRNTVLVMMLSGALAGLAGMSEVTGVIHRLQGSLSPGYGYTGIIIAWLARLNPFGVVISSVLFGALILAGREIQPAGVPKLIQGMILFMLIASDVLTRYRIRIVKN